MSISPMHDLRLALRTLRTRPGLSAVIVTTLALGIGASAAMFSLVDPVLLRPMPFERPDRLAVVWGSHGPERSLRGASPIEVSDWRRLNRAFQDIAVFDPISLNLRTSADPVRVQGEWITSPYFDVLGIRPARGRGFRPEEDAGADAHAVVVIGHDFWQARLGGSADALGSVLTLNDQPFTVVGIAPPGFRGLTFQADLWAPLSMISLDGRPGLLTERGNRWLAAVGRLRDGVTFDAAQADMDRVGQALVREFPDQNRDRGVTLVSLEANVLGSNADLFKTLFGAVLLFLLIACANVASLQLVRATGRTREMALRLALGARRGQVARQLLIEGLVLALLGGGAGVLLANWAVALLVPLAPAGLLPPYADVAVDLRVLGFSLVLTVLAGVVCGLAPAWLAARRDLSDALREGARASASGLGRLRRPGPQQLLVAAEVAVALVLLVGAGLMTRSLNQRLAVRTGFAVDGVEVARVSLPGTRYGSTEERVAFADRLVASLQELPFVAAAAVSSDLPMRGVTNAGRIQPVAGGEWIRAFRHSVTPDFFDVLQVPILEGRSFTRNDRADTEPVVIVSDAMARRFWPDRDPVGQRIRLSDSLEATIVGVAGDLRFRDLTTELGTTEPDVFYPFSQRPATSLEIAVRWRAGGPPAAAAVRRVLTVLDPSLPLFAAAPLAAGLQSQLAAARFGSLVLAVFSAVALALAAIGIYGVVSFVVGQSRREIAIRMALGADRRRVLGAVVRNGMVLVLVGAAAGVLGARLGSRALASQLYGVGVTDPGTFALVTAALVTVALLASWLPARRAAAVEPQAVLKDE